MKKHQPKKHCVKRFLQIMQTDDDERMLAIHEAAHKVIWKACFPDVRLDYVWNDEGNAGVSEIPRRNEPYHLKDMSREDATKHIVIKLAGYAAEMIEAGISDDIQLMEVVSWAVRDMYAGKEAVIDWKDDYDHGGDIGEACAAIEYLGGGATSDLLRQNLFLGFKTAVANLRNMWDDVLGESENFRVFLQTKCNL